MALLVTTAVACAATNRASPPPGPRLTLVAGLPAQDPAPDGCELAEWKSPWGSAIRICMDASTSVAITPEDVVGFRLDDREYGEERWYQVSAHLTGEVQSRIWRLLGEAPGTDGAASERSYAILVDGRPSIVQPAIGIGEVDSLVAVTQDLSRAEAIAYGWAAPVTRVISSEIAKQPVRAVSMVQLIANPAAWIGKRVSVQGFLAPTLLELYLSREHAESLDRASSIDLLQPATDAASAEALSECEGKWVALEGFVDSHGGAPRLTHVERITALRGGDCWPPPKGKRRPHY